MRIGDVSVYPVFDGVIPLPPGLLYPDVPVPVWQEVPGALDGDGMLPVPLAVGLSAVMAAVAAGATRIIVGDVHPARLDLALRLGATDVFDAVGTDSVARIRELAGGRGAEFSVESTGMPEVMSQAVAALAPLGCAAILGVAPGADLRTDSFALLEGRSVTGSIVGHQAPAVLIPRILDLHAQGRFPLEAMIRTYPLEEIGQAVKDVRSGTSVKAVLLH
jgi:aryl-alcohol dehydrogenase